jgi:hypothetical protein
MSPGVALIQVVNEKDSFSCCAAYVNLHPEIGLFSMQPDEL